MSDPVVAGTVPVDLDRNDPEAHLSPNSVVISSVVDSTDVSLTKTRSFAPEFRPRLACSVSFYPEKIVFTQWGREFYYGNNPQLAQHLKSLFMMMDHGCTLAEIQASFSPDSHSAMIDILSSLEEQGLLDEAMSLPYQSGPYQNGSHQTLSDEVKPDEVEALMPCKLAKQLIAQHLTTHDFWQLLRSPSTDLSQTLLYGFALEYHHYLTQKSAFQAPLLDFQNSAALQQAFLQLYCSELGQAEAIAKALAAAGLKPQAIEDHLPLPETVALVNGLAFWAQTEPLFLLSLQGILSEQLAQLMTTYYLACSAQSLEPDFIMQVGECVINGRNGSAAQLSLNCSEELLQLSSSEQQRFVGQIHLFVELYCNWLTAIARDYSQAPQLQRSVSALVGDWASPEQPRLKSGVLLHFKSEEIEIRGQGQGIAIAIPSAEQPILQQCLRSLQVGYVSRQQLSQMYPGLQVQELLTVLESRGWLSLSTSEQPLTGSQFYRELSRFLTHLKQQFPASPMSQLMLEGTITRNQLIGYVLESYHVTHLCPRLLAPALAQAESRKTQALLQEFFISELHHDRLIENSLQCIGIPQEKIYRMQPLPMTFGVCSALGVFARRHSLSFKAALMLFEEDDKTFHQLFEQCCKALGLPAEFYRPILLHSHINEDGEHDQITQLLLQELPLISPEEQRRVKQNMAVLMTSIVLRTHEILGYYGNPKNLMPRCF